MRKTDPSHKIEPTKFDFWLRRGQPKAPAYFVAPYSGARNAGRASIQSRYDDPPNKRAARKAAQFVNNNRGTDRSYSSNSRCYKFWSFPGPNNLSTFAGSQISGAIRKAKSAS